MGNLGAPELLIILAIVLLLFGSTRLPKMARSLGQASKEFKKGIDQGASEEDGADAKPAAKDPEPQKTVEKTVDKTVDKTGAAESEAPSDKAVGEAKA